MEASVVGGCEECVRGESSLNRRHLYLNDVIIYSRRSGVFHITHRLETLSQNFLKFLANIEGKPPRFLGLYDSLFNRRQQDKGERMWSLHLEWVLPSILRNTIRLQVLLLLIRNKKPLLLK